MTTYPKANTQAAWYQDNFPGAAMDPNCGVIHTTEGTSLPSYSGGATAPNYTAVPDFRNKRLNWFAHFPDERSSRALRNLSGGVETNTANAIQVELVGTCDPGTRDRWKRAGATFIFWPDAPQWALDDLAEFIAWCNQKHGIRIDGPRGRWTPYPESYGAGGQRFSFARWRTFYGWCGHQHVPENTHGDPGALDWEYVERKAKAIVAGDKDPEPEPPRKPWHKRRVPLKDRLLARRHGLKHVHAIAWASREAGVPFWAACALMEKESHGRNVFGHDQGGAGPHGQRVTKARYQAFIREVLNGATSNGVGPAQITYAGPLRGGKRDGGYFTEMHALGLEPWKVRDNMKYGFAILRDHYNGNGDSWEKAGTRYNGRESYGADFLARCKVWKARISPKSRLNPSLDFTPRFSRRK